MARNQTSRLENTNNAPAEYEAETVVCTLEGITTDVASRIIYLIADVYWAASAAATTSTMRIRRGTTAAGTEVSKVAISDVKSAKNELTLQCQDILGDSAGASYCITMAEAAAEKQKPSSASLRAEW